MADFLRHFVKLLDTGLVRSLNEYIDRWIYHICIYNDYIDIETLDR